LSAGFSRSREFLADRMACTLYGTQKGFELIREVHRSFQWSWFQRRPHGTNDQ